MMSGEDDPSPDFAVSYVEGPAGPELLFEDQPVLIRRMPGGRYVLDEDAYGPVLADPMELATQFSQAAAVAKYVADQVRSSQDQESAK